MNLLPLIASFVIYIYDKYRYPLSKHINTVLQANITFRDIFWDWEKK